ncbi:hypothetical protein RBSH_01027 [Rhodopirellula baltica SH28]|uniref:Uncharacterized protein n=2 Tax=Rhodopirellula baltica TaxID=265606 RepID=F2B0K2_RHOBT|nr:hypothetical protein RBWH47_00102 [Rhodopirellula baltica WH47]EKK03578.1 hypothetical protein RBSH_01027 [Rhodopirellula baltica SH28]
MNDLQRLMIEQILQLVCRLVDQKPSFAFFRRETFGIPRIKTP